MMMARRTSQDRITIFTKQGVPNHIISSLHLVMNIISRKELKGSFLPKERRESVRQRYSPRFHHVQTTDGIQKVRDQPRLLKGDGHGGNHRLRTSFHQGVMATVVPRRGRNLLTRPNLPGTPRHSTSWRNYRTNCPSSYKAGLFPRSRRNSSECPSRAR